MGNQQKGVWVKGVGVKRSCQGEEKNEGKGDEGKKPIIEWKEYEQQS